MKNIVNTQLTLQQALNEGCSTERPSSQKKWMHVSRWRAAAIHLGISIGLAVAVFVGMAMIWYPAPYFDVSGGKSLLMLLMGVDVVLGPLITLIIFNPRKKSLKFDLAVIALIQISALAYGASVIFQARPAYTVFVKDSFHIVSANDIEDEYRAKAADPKFRSLPLTGPQIVAATDVTSNADEKELVTIATMMGSGVQSLPQFYRPYRDFAESVLAQAQSLTAIRLTKPQFADIVEQRLKEQNISANKVALVPVHAKTQQLTAIIDNKSAEVLAIFQISPGN